MRRALALAVSVVALLWLGCPGSAAACGSPDPIAKFWYRGRPGEPLERYLAGHLGIIDPAHERAYRYVAWRYLSGQGLDAASREAVATYWRTERPATEPYDRPSFELWRAARARVPGVKYIYAPYPNRTIRKTVDGVERWIFYDNCLDDTFRTAARTLDDRIGTLGADAEIVRAWVAAQDQVFSNCENGESIPEPLTDPAPPPAGADRAYQIAAAHFYAGHFEAAERQFRAIAQDETSPWKAMAAYLIGRALVRQGTVDEPEHRERLEAAVAHLRGVLADASLVEVHRPAERLVGYALLELDPIARQRELAASLRAPRLGPPAGDTLFDYLWLLRREERRSSSHSWPLGREQLLSPGRIVTAEEPPEPEEMGAWIIEADPVGHWRRARSLPWLVAALPFTHPLQPEFGELLAAAERVPPDSPAYLTVAYHRIRLMIAQERFDDARRELDRLLAARDGELSLGDRNRLLVLRTPLATDLGEFLRLAQKVPADVVYEDGSETPIPPDDPLARLRGQPMLDDYSAYVLGRDFTPAMLLEAVRRDELVPRLRADVARAAWVRALMLGEYEVAGEVGPLVAQLVPELRDEVDAMRAAPPAAREFTLAFMLLRRSELQPDVATGVETPWAAWLCTAAEDKPSLVRRDTPLLSFLTAEQRAAAAAMRERLWSLQPGQLWLGRTVLAWAEAHSDDARVPKALHRVVQQSREGCTRDGSTMVQAAFRRLHRRYPHSAWTAKTPYWHR